MSQPGAGRRRPGTPRPPVRSVRPFKSSEQYLEAMKEDLAEWLRDLYGLDIDAANFLQALETGLVLCQHANAVTEAALVFLAEAPARAQRIPLPRAGVSCNGAAQPGTFQARDNISNFIQWCRKEMGIQGVNLLSEAQAASGVRNHGPPSRFALGQLIPFHASVQSLVSRCTCPVQFSMVKVSEGKYCVGDSNTLIFIRILRNHVMDSGCGTAGGGNGGPHQQEFNPFLLSSLWGAVLVAHKTGSFLKPPVPPVQHEVRVEDGPSQPQPTMTISRSQSPLPSVDWKTYTSSGRKLRPPAASSPTPHRERRAGAGILRETAPFPRCQEKSLAPSWGQLPAGDSPLSPQSSPTPRGRDPQCTSSGKREDRCPPELPRRRTPTSWVHEETDSWGTRARTPISQGLQAPEATTTGTPAGGPSPLPCSSSPAKPVGPRPPPRGEAEGASSQLRETASVHSPSPVKGPTKIPVQLPPACPLAPGRSFPGTA
ncbi:hypothetical protein E2I00_010676, partial [Balaenoptera physalus]